MGYWAATNFGSYYSYVTNTNNACGEGGCGMVNECVDGSGNKNCVDGCAPGCASCEGDCGGACDKNCTGTCEGNCNVGCTGGATDTIAARLYVHEFIEAANVQDIIDLVKYQLQRRGGSPTSDTLTADATKTTAAIFQHIRSNLQQINLGKKWVKDNDGHWYFVWENGGYVKNVFVYWNGAYYYLNNSGHMLENTWQTINGQSYHFNSDGAMDSGPTPHPENIYVDFGDDAQDHVIYKSMAQHLVDCGLDAYRSPIATS